MANAAPLRNTLFHGPGFITFGETSFLAADDIKVAVKPVYEPVVANGFGPIDNKRNDLIIEVTCTPLEWNNLSLLLPYADKQIGESLFGDTDVPLSVIPRNGANSGITLANAVVTKLPNIRWAATKGSLGSMTFTGILANGGDPADMADYYTLADVGDMPTPDLTKLRNGIYSGVWGTQLPFIGSEDGFEFVPEMTTKATQHDGFGTIDYELASLNATLKVNPVGVSMAQMLAALAGPVGGSPIKNDFLLKSNGATVFTLPNTQCLAGESEFGNDKKRVASLDFASVRTALDGALTPAWIIA